MGTQEGRRKIAQLVHLVCAGVYTAGVLGMVLLALVARGAPGEALGRYYAAIERLNTGVGITLLFALCSGLVRNRRAGRQMLRQKWFLAKTALVCVGLLLSLDIVNARIAACVALLPAAGETPGAGLAQMQSYLLLAVCIQLALCGAVAALSFLKPWSGRRKKRRKKLESITLQ